MNKEERKILLPAWRGEFGWEIMSWAPICRRTAQERNCENVTIQSFKDMQALYADFADEFIANKNSARALTYPKHYRHNGIFYKYGNADEAGFFTDVLVHARAIRRKSSINYRYWPQLSKMITKMGLTIGFIGTNEDGCLPGYPDFREIKLQKLMDKIAASKLVIGVSSGVMHLAAACGTNMVVWGDNRTYFGETLEQRYKVTWNPFEVRVGWITANNWQPQPAEIIKKIELLLKRTKNDLPLRDTLREAI